MAKDPLGKHPGSVIKVIASPGDSVMTAHACGPRSEVMTKAGLKAGVPYVITFDFLNTAPNNFITTFCQILDSPKNGLTQPRIKMALAKEGYTLTCRTSPDGEASKSVVMAPCVGDVNKWTSWRIELLRKSAGGHLRVYKDGKLIGSLEGVATMYADNLLESPLAHAKFGQYKHAVDKPTTVYFANVCILP